MLDCFPSAARPLTVRSAVTNDPLMLRGVDGRSMVARRYRDVAIALAEDLGGQDKLSEPSKILVRQAAALTVQVEGLQSKILAGEDIDLEQLTRLSNVLGRTLQRLGSRSRARGRQLPLRRTLHSLLKRWAREAPQAHHHARGSGEPRLFRNAACGRELGRLARPSDRNRRRSADRRRASRLQSPHRPRERAAGASRKNSGASSAAEAAKPAPWPSWRLIWRPASTIGKA